MEGYHGSVTPTDTPTRKLRPYEYVVRPPIARVLIAICQHCGIGGTIQPGVRQLAVWANFASAGRISPLLHQLATDGWILYDPESGTITLLADPDGPIPEGDRPISDGDQDAIPEGDRPISDGDRGSITAADQVIPGADQAIPARDRFRVISPRDRRMRQQDAEEDSITSRDRIVPRMEDHDLAATDRESDSAAATKTLPCEAESITLGDRSPAAEALAALGFVNAKIIAQALAARPDVTAEHVDATWAEHLRRAGEEGEAKARATFCSAIRTGDFRAPAPPPSRGPIDAQRYLGGAYGDLFRLGSDDADQEPDRGVA
jgi:hypothetical protein